MQVDISIGNWLGLTLNVIPIHVLPIHLHNQLPLSSWEREI